VTVPAVRLSRVCLNVSSLSHAVIFYRDALGFMTLADDDDGARIAQVLAGANTSVRSTQLGLGSQRLQLVEFDPPGAPYPSDSTAADLWFQHFAIVTSDMATACQRLHRHDEVAITVGGPQRLPLSAGSVVAYKFRDPDGHPLELIEFPPGASDPTWQYPASAETKGIDHSAISVADTDRSLVFYRRLGLVVQSQTLNTGSEQDRLDGLSRVAVEVTALATAGQRTPHLELLCYRTPRGRPGDPVHSTSGIWDSSLILHVEDLSTLVQGLMSTGAVASSGVASLSNSQALIRDPDGHALILIEHREGT
jgi:catechol 2,3-dioxygenase-like lactoylglutathione lyase family enzyme